MSCIAIVRRVTQPGQHGCIEVRPDADELGFVEVETAGVAANHPFGSASLTLPAPVARALGQALIAAADEAPL